MAGDGHIAVATTLFTTLSGSAQAIGKRLWKYANRWCVSQLTVLVTMDSNDSMQ